MRPRRYQVRKETAAIVASGHPWIFRGQMSSAAAVFADGDWLRLVDGGNRVVGHGMYEAQGAIAIRVLERGPRAPDASWVEEKVIAALARRAALRAGAHGVTPRDLVSGSGGDRSVGETDGFRAVHGESDGLPAVVVDVYRDTAVLATYASGADALGRLVASRVCRALTLDRVLWKPAHRRALAGGPGSLRALFGALPAGPIEIREGPLTLTVDVSGQKSGAYLDLRGLRRWILEQDLAGARVLNLFSYTGTLGLAARTAGARTVWNVDSSRAAIEMAARHHGGGADDVVADVFEWLPRLARRAEFELVIADPPPMTSRMEQVAGALAAYRRLYRAAAPHVAPGGRIVACCCTSRIDARSFQDAVRAGLGKEFRLERRIPPEPDHPVGFAEADYLKVLVYSRAVSS